MYSPPVPLGLLPFSDFHNHLGTAVVTSSNDTELNCVRIINGCTSYTGEIALMSIIGL